MSYLALARAALSRGTSDEKNEENEQSRAPVADRRGEAIQTRDSSFTSFISFARSPGSAQAHVERLLAAGERAVLSPDAVTDEAELTVRGEPLP
jgi:hypothetical protein